MKKLMLFISSLFLGHSCMAAAPHYAITRVSSAYTMSGSEQMLLVTGSGYNINLPQCSGTNDGDFYVFRNISGSSNSVQLVPHSGDTIEKSVGFFFVDFQADCYVCDGPNKNWVGINYW